MRRVDQHPLDELGVGGEVVEVVRRCVRRESLDGAAAARDAPRTRTGRAPSGARRTVAVASRPARPSTSTSVITSPSACTRMRPPPGRAVATADSVAEMPALVSSSARPPSAATSSGASPARMRSHPTASRVDSASAAAREARPRRRAPEAALRRTQPLRAATASADNIRPQQRTLDDDRDAGPAASRRTSAAGANCRVGDDDGDGAGRRGLQRGVDPSGVARHHDDRAVWLDRRGGRSAGVRPAPRDSCLRGRWTSIIAAPRSARMRHPRA